MTLLMNIMLVRLYIACVFSNMAVVNCDGKSKGAVNYTITYHTISLSDVSAAVMTGFRFNIWKKGLL